MVLVDTSVWIRALAGKQPYQAGLDALLDDNEVIGHDLVYGELMIGDKGVRTQFLQVYEQMDRAEAVPHVEVAALVRHRKLYGRGLSWVDAHLIASALAEGCRVWTADEALARVSEELGVAYR